MVLGEHVDSEYAHSDGGLTPVATPAAIHVVAGSSPVYAGRIDASDPVLATMRLYRNGSLVGTYGKNEATPSTWIALQLAAQAGDVVEITPGAINATAADAANYYNFLDASSMTILKSLTIRAQDPTKPWRLYPVGYTPPSTFNGINIWDVGGAPGDVPEPLTVDLSGFDMSGQFGRQAAGVRLRSPGLGSVSSWATFNRSVRISNFKIGTLSDGSLSGITGAAELLTIEDGEVFDCADGSGQEHNLYCSSRVMNIVGVRSYRTRGWPSTPYVGFTALDGHMAKLEAVTGLIEGSSFDAAALSDHTLMTQLKGGGNWVIRGCLYIDSAYPNNENGAINMCRETNVAGGPNYDAWAHGDEGNSLVVERSVFIGHFPRPIVWFFPTAHPNALQAATGGSFTPAQRLQSLVVRDNIAMVASVARTSVPYGGLPGFSTQDPTTRPMWINNDPNAGPTWGARANEILTYDQTEAAFSQRDAKRYLLAAGPITTANGTLATRRFVLPHGSIARSDNYKGLG